MCSSYHNNNIVAYVTACKGKNELVIIIGVQNSYKNNSKLLMILHDSRLQEVM